MYDWRIYIVLILSLCALSWLLEKPLSGQIANDVEDEKERFTSCSASNPHASNITTRDLHPVKSGSDDDDTKEKFENYESINNTSADPSSLSMGPKMSIYGSSSPMSSIGAIIKPMASKSLSNVYVYKTDAEEEANPPEDVIKVETPTPTPLEQTLSPPPEMPPIDVLVAKLDQNKPQKPEDSDTEDEDDALAPRTLGTGGFPTPSQEEIRQQKAELDRLLGESVTPPPLAIQSKSTSQGMPIGNNEMDLASYAQNLEASVTPAPLVDADYMETVTPLPFIWTPGGLMSPTPTPNMSSTPGPKPITADAIKNEINNLMGVNTESGKSPVFEKPLTGFGTDPL